MADTLTVEQKAKILVISVKNEGLVHVIEDLAEKTMAVDNSSMAFFHKAKEIYTVSGKKQAEDSFTAINTLISAVCSKDYTKSVVNRLKKVNGIVYDIYKNDVKAVATLTTFGNLEEISSYISKMSKASANGEKLWHTPEGGVKKVIDLSTAKGAMTRAVSAVSTRLMKTLKVKALDNSHYKMYNDALTDAISEIVKTYTNEKTEQMLFEAIEKSIKASVGTMSKEHRDALKLLLEVAEVPAMEKTEDLEKKVS